MVKVPFWGTTCEASPEDAEIIGALRASIAQALAAGQGFESWRKDARELHVRLASIEGCTLTDDEGRLEAWMVDFSDPDQIRNFFLAVVRIYRAIAQWERVQRTKLALPFLVYVGAPSPGMCPPEHGQWAGTILPVDDPWWKSHRPPNRWRCFCGFRAMSRFEREKWLAVEAPDAT